MRARPVPFCFHSFLPDPATSARTLVLCVPARWPAWNCRTASYSSASFTSAANTSSASSISPTFLLLQSTTSTVGMPLPLGPPDHYIPAVRPRNRAFHHQHVILGVHLDHFQVPHRHALVTHVPRHAHTRQHPGREARCADRTRRPVEHRSVRCRAAAKMVPLHQTRKP